MVEERSSRLVGLAVAGLGRVLPYIGIVGTMASFFVVMGLGRLDTSLRGLYLAAPIIMASVLLLRRRKSLKGVRAEEDRPWMALSNSRFAHLILLNVIIFMVSIILLLISETRPPAYFVLMAVFAGIVFVQVLGMRSSSGWQKGIILGSLVVLTLNLTWCITLKYPLYFGGTDILPHLHYIDSVLQASHVGDYMGIYQHTPLYHILLGSGIEVLGLGLRDGFFLLVALAYVPAILFAYLVFKSITGSERLSLLACLLLAVSVEFIYYGGYMVTRSLAFVFFMAILYLMFRKPRTVPALAVLGIFTATLVLTHQTTLVYMIGILALFVGFQWLLARPQPNPGRTIRFASIYLAVLAVAFMSYWVAAAPDYAHWMVGRVGTGIVDVVDPPPDVVDRLPDVAVPVVADESSFVRGIAPDMVFLFFGWLGFAYLLRRARDKRYLACTAVGLVGLVCLVFYVPSPVDFVPILRNLFLIQRVPLLLTVFMSLSMAYGIVVLAKSGPLKKAASPILIAAVVAFSFFSMGSVRNASDVPDFRPTNYGERRYFTEAALSAMSFAEEQLHRSIPVYSGYYARRYFVDRPAHIIAEPDISYIRQGYVLLRVGELKDRWLFFSRGPFYLGANTYRYRLDDVEPADSILEHLASQNKIYENGPVQINMIDGA